MNTALPVKLHHRILRIIADFYRFAGLWRFSNHGVLQVIWYLYYKYDINIKSKTKLFSF